MFNILGSLSGRSVAFTMAEILLSLTIIGVVAAITLPSLTGNINERTWNTQRKALFARMSQSVSLLNGMKGYVELQKNGDSGGGDGWGDSYYSDSASEKFLSSALSKVFKLNNICDPYHISDCGMPSEVTNMVGSKVNIASMTYLGALNDIYCGIGFACGYNNAVFAESAALETHNGESALVFYNPACKEFESFLGSWDGIGIGVSMCLNMIYDLNGKKGPNTVGKDIGFITVYNPYDPVVVAPLTTGKLVSSTTSLANAGKVCSEQSGGEYRLPTRDEVMSMALNYKLIDEEKFNSGGYLATSSKGTRYDKQVKSYAYDATYRFMSIGYVESNSTVSVRCVQR